MSGDVGKVQGPSGAPDSLGKKDTSSADRERFQAVMREEASKVSAIDPDEQKKHKRREEIEEETKIALKTALENETQPPSEPTPFLVTKSPARTELLGMGGSRASGTASSGPASPHVDTPSSEELLQTPSSTTQHLSSPTSYKPSTAPSEPSKIAATQSQEGMSSSPEEKKKESDLKKAPLEAAEQMKFKEKMLKKQETQNTAALQEVGPSIQGAMPLKAAEEKAVQEGLAPIQETDSEAIQAGAAPGGRMISKAPSPVEPLISPLPGSSSEPETPEVLHARNAYAKLSPEVQELFNRMVGVMTVMHLSGIKETSFILNMPQFASSVFFGARIIIQEFSSAPNMFNIQFSGSDQAVSLFQTHTAGLMAAFQANQYNFRIHRLETSYLTERPQFRRKEERSDSQHDDKGDSKG